MSTISARVSTHWFNGWVMRMFARPYVIVDGEEYEAAWDEEITLTHRFAGVQSIGAGMRYFGKGRLGGYDPQPVDATPTATVELRNGFFNHSPFRVISAA